MSVRFETKSPFQQESKRATEMDRNLRYSLDADISDCPICTEPLSLPVYQCENGHTICSPCCKKIIKLRCPSCSQPTGRIRCLMVEKIIESLQVSCKHADHGCKEMLQYSKRAEREKHEKETCKHKPLLCPHPSCMYEGPSSALPSHLVEVHEVQRMQLNSSRCVKFLMSSVENFMMVELDADGVMLVHCEAKTFGDAFFCSTISEASNVYNIKVKRSAGPSVSQSVYTMETSTPNIHKVVEKSCSCKECLIISVVNVSHFQEFDVEVSLPLTSTIGNRMQRGMSSSS